MKRISIEPRNKWQEAVEKIGFGFHSSDVPYWNESAYYEFSMPEILKLEEATHDLWAMCIDAVQYVIDNKMYEQFAIPQEFVPMIESSWNNDVPSIYGRFDLRYDGINPPKMLEFNADTPTSLFEAAIVQWYWLQDLDASQDQFNSIHEKLVEYWGYLKNYLNQGSKLHFACLKGTIEDLTNTEYLRDCAIQGGIETSLIYMDEIGWNEESKSFVDNDDVTFIRNIFKLYPWELMIRETFGPHIIEDTSKTIWIEPAWKMILSNKAILAVLWELFPDHPNLLPASFEPDPEWNGNYIKKPILSREGANIEIFENGKSTISSSNQGYGKEGYVYQLLDKLPDFNGSHPVIGSWVIGQQPAGMGIRESDGLITGNTSKFIPHLINIKNKQ